MIFLVKFFTSEKAFFLRKAAQFKANLVYFHLPWIYYLFI